jgi:hypothetical protein
MEKRILLFILSGLLLISITSAQDIALDIKIGKQIYSIGENVT